MTDTDRENYVPGMTFSVDPTTERVGIRARLPQAQQQTWRANADANHITLTGLLVAITPHLDDILENHPDIVPDAKAYDLEVRRRPK